MKNALATIKANKTTIIKSTLVVAATVTAIVLVGYAYKHNAALDVAELVAD
jgi:hypothetical protein